MKVVLEKRGPFSWYWLSIHKAINTQTGPFFTKFGAIKDARKHYGGNKYETQRVEVEL